MPKKKEQDNAQTSGSERTAEEVAWDEEFKDDNPPNIIEDLNDFAEFVVKLPGTLVSEFIPSETVKHTRAAAREGFLAVRSLLGILADGIEDMLAEPGSASETATATASTATVKGPAGTWGSGRSAQPSGKAKRIEIAE